MGEKIDITNKRSRALEIAFVWTCRLCILIPLAVLAALLIDVAMDGVGRLSWDFIQGLPSRRAWKAGIKPALVGSIYLISVTALLALPVGIGAAVYLEEYAKRGRFSSVVEVNIANLAGVPSVIYGLLGLEVFVRVMKMGPSLLAGACTLALLVLPIVIMSTREALRTVPHSVREGALGLGATRWQTVRGVVLPAALPGILTGAILSISRAVGETAPLIIIGAVVYITFLPKSLSSEFTALPIQIFNWVSMPQKEFVINAAAGIVVLLLTLLAFNATAIILRNRLQKRRVF